MARRYRALPEQELRAILRAADDIIGQGGRALLSKILKGSKDRKLLELGLDKNPAYGFYKDLKIEEIMKKIDHMIDTDFLDTEKFGKLPMIVFTARGWAIERERRAEEFLQEWNHWLENGIVPISMEYLKERNRGMVFLLLYKVLCTGDKKYIPFLRMWERIAFKKVQAEIRRVIGALEARDKLNQAEWEQLKIELAKALILREEQPIILVCHNCDNPMVFREEDPRYYTSDGLKFPTLCPNCSPNE